MVTRKGTQGADAAPLAGERKPERYPHTKTQFRRLIQLVLLLVLMLFSVHWALQGKHWVWLTGLQKPPEPVLQELDRPNPATRRP